jgi:hypothetical protein
LSAASWDFHPASLAVPFIALAYLAVEEKQYTALLLSFVTVPLRGLFSLEQPRPGGDEAKRIVNDHDVAKAGTGIVSDSLKSGCLLLNFADLLMAVSLHRNLCIVVRIVKLSMLK